MRYDASLLCLPPPNKCRLMRHDAAYDGFRAASRADYVAYMRHYALFVDAPRAPPCRALYVIFSMPASAALITSRHERCLGACSFTAHTPRRCLMLISLMA